MPGFMLRAAQACRPCMQCCCRQCMQTALGAKRASCCLASEPREGLHKMLWCMQTALGAEQLSWLLNDLARINRAVTPWVLAAWHGPPV